MSKRKVYVTEEMCAQFAVEVEKGSNTLILSIGDWCDDEEHPSQYFSYNDVFELIEVLKKKAKKIAPVMDDGPF
jgi:hypothetical protein